MTNGAARGGAEQGVVSGVVTCHAVVDSAGHATGLRLAHHEASASAASRMCDFMTTLSNGRHARSDFKLFWRLASHETYVDYINVGGFQAILENKQAETKGPQIYSRRESAPVFAPGSFDGTGEGIFNVELTPGNFVSLATNITFTAAKDVTVPPNPTPVPEPSTWALGLGFSAAAAMYGLRRRRRAG
jgi:hypothetical protein